MPRMEFLRGCWAALVRAPAPAPQYPDLETYGGDAQGVVIVTDAADVCVQTRPLLRVRDLHGAGWV
jgi:hypothetical protein